MTSLLRARIEKIKKECQQKGIDLVIEKTRDYSSWTLSNEESCNAVIIGEVDAGTENHSIMAFEINVPRWNWAIEEGFTRDEIINKLGHEVFFEMHHTEIVRYLK